MIKLSIIIPAYNEQDRIVSALSEYYKFFYQKLKNEFEIIVVPNNCKDNTLKIVEDFCKNKKNFKFINIPYYVGKGGAVIEGFKIAKGKTIGFVDADMSTRPDAFYDLYTKLNGYDGIIGSRWIKGAKINIKQQLTRRIASRAFNILVRTLFSINLRDTQCGAKLFKRKKLLKVLPDITTPRWAFDVDLLYQFKRKKYKLIEIPTVWSESKGSTLNVQKASIEMLLAIIRLRLNYSPLKFIVKLANEIDKMVHKK